MGRIIDYLHLIRLYTNIFIEKTPSWNKKILLNEGEIKFRKKIAEILNEDEPDATRL